MAKIEHQRLQEVFQEANEITNQKSIRMNDLFHFLVRNEMFPQKTAKKPNKPSTKNKVTA